MNEPNRLRSSSLDQVKSEINRFLDEAYTSLGAEVENNNEAVSRLQCCHELIRKVDDRLQLMPLPGTSLLTKEMMWLMNTLLADNTKVQNRSQPYEVLVSAIRQLSDYLGRMQWNQADAASFLSPLIKDLRFQRSGETAIIAESLFASDFSDILPPGDVDHAALPEDDLPALIKRTRHRIHLSMLGLFRGENVEKSLYAIIDLCDQYRVAASSMVIKQLYWIASALCEGMLDAGLAPDAPPVKQLLGQIDRQSKMIIDSGEEKLTAPPPYELIRVLLYYVASSSSKGKRVTEIKAAFRLREYLPEEDELEGLHGSQAGPDSSTIETVTQGITQVFDQARYLLDAYHRTDREQGKEQLRQLVQVLRDAAGMLAMTGDTELQARVEGHCNDINAFIHGNESAEATGVQELADFILRLEARIRALREEGINRVSGEEVTSSPVEVVDSQKIRPAAMRESAVNIGAVKDLMATLAESPDRGQWQAMSSLLQKTAAHLSDAALERMSEMSVMLSSFIDRELVRLAREPEEQELAALTKAISGIDRYLMAVADQSPGEEVALEAVSAALGLLDSESGNVTKASEVFAEALAEEGGKTGLISEETPTQLKPFSENLQQIYHKDGSPETAGSSELASDEPVQSRAGAVQHTPSGDPLPKIEKPGPFEQAEQPGSRKHWVNYRQKTHRHLEDLRRFINDCRADRGNHFFEEPELLLLHKLHADSAIVGAYDLKKILDWLEPIAIFCNEYNDPVDTVLLELFECAIHQVQQFLDWTDNKGPEFVLDVDLMEELERLFQQKKALSRDAFAEPTDTSEGANLVPFDEYTLDEINSSLEDLHRLMSPEVSSEDRVAEISPDKGDNGTEWANDQPGDFGDAAEVITDAAEVDPEMLSAFLEEATGLLQSVEQTLNAWQNDQANRNLMVSMQRDVNTLKNGARLINQPAMVDIGYAMEALLVAMTEGQVQASDLVFATLREAKDVLDGFCEDLKQGDFDVVANMDLVTRLKLLNRDTQAEENIGSAAFPMTMGRSEENASAGIMADNNDNADTGKFVVKDKHNPSHVEHEVVGPRPALIDYLVNFVGETHVCRSSLEQRHNAFRSNLDRLERTVVRLRKQLKKLETENDARQPPYHENNDDNRGDGSAAGLGPLEISSVQRLLRGLVKSTDDLNSLQNTLDDLNRDSERLLLQQKRIDAELQDRLTQAIVVPFSETVAPHLHQITRETCQQLGKRVLLKIQGGEKKIDRYVLNRIAAPLGNMLQNAITYSIESPQIRKKCDKPETGTMTVFVKKEAGEIVIQLVDDGAGLDAHVIREKAKRSGFITEDADMTYDEVMQLVLMPGFTTVDTISQTVRMDVADNEVKQLNGSLHIESTAGCGTVITMRLPFVLPITQALLLRVANDLYAIPLSSIEGVSRIDRDEAEELIANKDYRYAYGGVDYQLSSLDELLGGQAVTGRSGSARPAVVLTHISNHRIGFCVDELLGKQEVVVKSLGIQMSVVNGIVGGAILGDGHVALILDMPAFVHMFTTGRNMPQTH